MRLRPKSGFHHAVPTLFLHRSRRRALVLVVWFRRGPEFVMAFFDVVDVLLREHDEIRRLCSAVERSRDEGRERRFAELSRVVHLHECGERAVIHPAARKVTATGDMIGAIRLLEENAIGLSLAALDGLGAGHPSFDQRFVALHRAILEHMTREELDEFPLLRLHLPAQRLHWMVGELHDVRSMAAA
jgi:hypothetical protein